MANQENVLATNLNADRKRSDSHSLRNTLLALLRNRSGLIGSVVLVFMAILVVAGPALAPMDPNEVVHASRLETPSRDHWFGADNFGRDLLSRILVGARLTVLISVSAIVFALLIAVPAGLLGGYYGGKIDHALSAVLDIFLAFPTIFLGLAIIAIFGVGITPVIIAIAIVSMPRFARVTRGETLTTKHRDYVEVARALGAPTYRILLRHVFPNITAVLIAYTTIHLGEAVVIAAGLSFLGVGVQPPSAEWGALLSDSRRYFLSAPHLTIFPGIAISLLVLGFNLAGDGLRDVLDPRLRG